MTNEEFDRKAEFLLNQQVRFDAGMRRLKDAQAVTEQKMAKAFEAAARASESADRASQLVARTIVTVENLSKVVLEGFRFTLESFKHTDEKLRDLARHTREDDNGVGN